MSLWTQQRDGYLAVGLGERDRLDDVVEQRRPPGLDLPFVVLPVAVNRVRHVRSRAELVGRLVRRQIGRRVVVDERSRRDVNRLPVGAPLNHVKTGTHSAAERRGDPQDGPRSPASVGLHRREQVLGADGE